MHRISITIYSENDTLLKSDSPLSPGNTEYAEEDFGKILRAYQEKYREA